MRRWRVDGYPWGGRGRRLWQAWLLVSPIAVRKVGREVGWLQLEISRSDIVLFVFAFKLWRPNVVRDVRLEW